MKKVRGAKKELKSRVGTWSRCLASQHSILLVIVNKKNGNLLLFLMYVIPTYVKIGGRKSHVC
jgi:hypothetical protein